MIVGVSPSHTHLITCVSYRRGFEPDHGPDDDDGHGQPHARHGHRAQGKGESLLIRVHAINLRMCLLFHREIAGAFAVYRSVFRIEGPNSPRAFSWNLYAIDYQ